MKVTKNQRLHSLDILRGLTIIFMIIVNTPGSWNHVYAPLLHAEWNGITPTDYIFPTFLFIVGVSIVLSFTKQIEMGKSQSEMTKKVLIRALKIYGVGIILWLWPGFNDCLLNGSCLDLSIDSIRWVGVLHRISFVFLACALLFLFTSRKMQIYIGIILLLFYWIIMVYVPVPGIGFPDLSIPEKNWAHYIDSLLLPGKLWEDTWDPEGILSTLPSVSTGIMGMLAGYILLKKEELVKKINQIFFLGFLLLFLGDLLQWFFPLNKNLWSSSFSLLMGGISSIALAASLYIFDFKQTHYKFQFAHAFGVNSILAYSLSSLLTVIFYSSKWWGISLNVEFMGLWENSSLPLKLGSLIYALFYVLIIWVPTYYLFKKKIFIKL